MGCGFECGKSLPEIVFLRLAAMHTQAKFVARS